MNSMDWAVPLVVASIGIIAFIIGWAIGHFSTRKMRQALKELEQLRQEREAFKASKRVNRPTRVFPTRRVQFKDDVFNFKKGYFND